MGTFIIKLKDEKFNKEYYMEWTCTFDTPISNGLCLEDFKKYYINKYGIYGSQDLNKRLERVEKNGTSGLPPYDNLQDFFENNCAGENGECIDKESILNLYCR